MKGTFLLARLLNHFQIPKKCLTIRVEGIFLIQNFTIFLVESFIFTVSFFLWVKNTDKVDPSEKNGFKAMFFMIPLRYRFSPIKWDLQQKWISPTESWWNSEQEPFLQHFCSTFLFVSKHLEGKYENFDDKSGHFQCILVKPTLFLMFILTF